MARKYFGADYGTLVSLTDQRIYCINAEKREKAQDRKWERVRRHLDLLPKKLPEAAINTLEQVIPHRGVLFNQKTKSGKRRVKCAACGKTYSTNDRFNCRELTTCPKCGAEIKIAKEKYISGPSSCDKEKLYFVHKTMDKGNPATLLIMANIERTINLKGKYEYRYDTDYFEVNTEGKIYPYKYNYQMYSYTDARYPPDMRAYICESEFKAHFKENAYKKINFELLEGKKISLYRIIASTSYGPLAGKLINKGMIRLAEDARYLTQSDTFEDVFGLDRNYMQSVRRWDLTYRELMIVQRADCWVDDNLFGKIRVIAAAQYFDRERFEKMLKMMSYRKAVGYIARQVVATHKTSDQVMMWYLDYIRMSEELLNKTYKKKDCKIEKCYMFPRNIEEAHDKVSDQLRCSNNPKKNRRIKAMYMRHHKEYEFTYKGLIAVMPKSIEDFISEGRKLNHCIASGDEYIDQHIAGEKLSFFIRKAEKPDEPYFTFSINVERMTKTDCNGKNHKLPTKEIEEFIKAFLQHLKTEKAAA